MFSALRSIFPKKAPTSADQSGTHKKQGDEHLKLGRLDSAAECYRSALSLDPGYLDACVGLGFVLSEQRQFSEARQHLQHAVAIDPANADVHYILGTIAKAQDDLIGSIAHFARALDIKPDFEFAYRDLVAALLHGQQIKRAKEVLERATSACPESAEFQLNLGNLLSRENELDRAVACYEKVLSIQPGSAECHKNLADALRKRGRPDEAIANYQKALWFAPNFVAAHIALADVMQSEGKLDQAMASYERAVTLRPECIAAQIGCGSVKESQGKVDEAMACYRRAIMLDPNFAGAHQLLGNALLAQGATQEAVACFEEVVRLDPENGSKHLLAALSGQDSERAPSDYVEKLFDQYASKFDAHLVAVLSYSDPEKLIALLCPYSDAEGEQWSVLDLGCGTGLSGVAIAHHARQLVGVDLSAKMLEKARERHLYDRLEHRDLLAMMQSEGPSSYDVVLSTDVFIYVGKLDGVVEQAQRLLRPGGFLAFSVESLDSLADPPEALSEPRDYKLNITGRYAHSSAYLARLAAHHNFEVLGMQETQTRLDKGKPVQGYLALWRRAPD